ncbi:hypothetical protein ACI782_12885 [Geodermatophilus sp. SYSU D00703]
MSVAVGSIRLHSAVRPSLPAGDYTLRLEHTIDADAVQPVDKTLRVVAPQFALPGTEVASVFPPPRAAGAFETRLPEIVLGRRTLPWERRLGTTGDAASAPWLALIVLTATEGRFRTGVPVTEVIPATKHGALGVSATSGTCDCLETSLNVAKAVFPRADELAWLCHVREVSLDDTELAGTDQDGYFSVVLSSRLPRTQHSYGAYLISLEGRADVLPAPSPGTPATAPGPAVVVPDGPLDQRFPVLAHWDFTVGAGSDFQALAQQIDVGSFGTAPDGCPGVTPTGHVITSHRTRLGRESAAWYRGPLTPREVGRRRPVPLFHADQARRIASDGLEDLSEAAAFELGRLLALADPTFTAAVQEWRRADFADGVAHETFGFVPGVTELGLDKAAHALALAATTALGDPSSPLGRIVPPFGEPVPLTSTDIDVISTGLGLMPKVVADVLQAPPLDPGVRIPTDADPLAAAEGFDQLVQDPHLLRHLRWALHQRVAATKARAGLTNAQFDPAAPAGSIPEIFGGGGP